jgi:NAD(P)-dependent dehydrogenase (short-subunit alcohol dehydrogenase family)
MSSDIRTAIVAGASKGIGAALAKRLAADGFHTVVNYASSRAEAEKVVAVIEAAGGRAISVCADVADASAVEMLFNEAEAAFGPVDVLVNNAGIFKVSPLWEGRDWRLPLQAARFSPPRLIWSNRWLHDPLPNMAEKIAAGAIRFRTARYF